MASRKRQTVDDWVKSVTTETIDGRACSAISCLHLKGVGGATEEVVTKPLEGTTNPTELANHLIGRAEGFSQDLGGLQTFKLIAFYGTNEPHNPFHFTTSDGNVMSRSETMMSAHEPTPSGLLGQLMKHNEAVMAQNAGLVAACMNLSNNITTMCFGADGVVQKSIGSQMEATLIVRDAMLNLHKEKKELIIAESEAKQKAQVTQAILDAAPHVLNRVTGREIVSEQHNDTKIMEALALKVKPQHLELLVSMGLLSKEESLILAARFTSIVEEKVKTAKALQSVPSEESAAKPTTALSKGNGGL